MEDKKIRLHTPEELEHIASTDFNRFKEIAKYYFDNDLEYYNKVVKPLLNKYPETNQNIDISNEKEYDIPIKKYNEYTTDELKILAENDYDKFYQLSKESYVLDNKFYAEMFRPILKKYKKERK